MTKVSQELAAVKGASLSELRSMVVRWEGLASRKIDRMAKTRNGYDVSGTNLDPRKGEAWVRRAGRRQLEAQAERLISFRRPSVGWRRSATGSPISLSAMRTGESAARTRNRRVQEIDDKLANYKIPWQGDKTYREVRADRFKISSGRERRINDEQGVRTTTKVKMSSRSFSSERAVLRRAAFDRSLETEAHVRSKMARTRSELEQLYEGNNRLLGLVSKLTDAQLYFAWSATPQLVNSSKLVYEFMLGELASEQIYLNEMGTIENILTSAANVPVKDTDMWAG